MAILRTDAGPGTRLGLALVWPLGPLAFALTVALLLIAGVVPLWRRLTRRS